MKTRRDFFLMGGSMSLLGFTSWRSPKAIWQLVAPTAFGQSGPAEFKDMYLSVQTAGANSSSEILPATQWKAGADVALKITAEPGGDDHPVILPGSKIAELISSGSTSFQSAIVGGHAHNVSVRLGNAVPGGNVITNTIENNTSNNNNTQSTPPTEGPTSGSDEALSAILGDGQQPYLYLESRTPLQANGIYYCRGTNGTCSYLDWTPMQEVNLPGRFIYRSRDPLSLNSGEIIHISALDIANVRRELHAEVSVASSGLFITSK